MWKVFILITVQLTGQFIFNILYSHIIEVYSRGFFCNSYIACCRMRIFNQEMCRSVFFLVFFRYAQRCHTRKCRIAYTSEQCINLDAKCERVKSCSHHEHIAGTTQVDATRACEWCHYYAYSTSDLSMFGLLQWRTCP